MILVTAPRDVQIARLRARNGFTRQQAEARLAAQMPLAEKRRFATFVIDNGSSLGNLLLQVRDVIAAIRARR